MKITIIGGGPGGYIAAIRAAQLGAEVTLIEKNAMGGTCLNVGCIPTKTLIHAADLFQEIKTDAGKNGVLVSDVSVDFAAMQKRKSAVVKQLVGGVSGLMTANGIRVIKGIAKFISASQIQVTGDDGMTTVSYDKAIIASGSVPVTPPISGHALAGVVDSTRALDFEEIPSSLCIIGGGVIGIEIAHIYQQLGSKVTIVEMLPDILTNLDADLTAVMKKHLKKRKVDLLLETKVDSIEEGAGDLVVNITDKEGRSAAVAAEKVLLCVGRRPATEELGLEELGVQLERNRIVVDEAYGTNVENIYAIGDCIGGQMLAHVASAEGIAAVEKIMGVDAPMDFRTVPSCVYTSPELSSVGLTQQEADALGLDYQVGRFPLQGNGRALIMGDTSGLVKMIADTKTGEVLGVHICGPGATELIAEGVMAIRKRATVEDFLASVHAHPSVGESLQEAAHAVFGDALNMPPARK